MVALHAACAIAFLASTFKKFGFHGSTGNEILSTFHDTKDLHKNKRHGKSGYAFDQSRLAK